MGRTFSGGGGEVGERGYDFSSATAAQLVETLKPAVLIQRQLRRLVRKCNHVQQNTIIQMLVEGFNQCTRQLALEQVHVQARLKITPL
jgi:hypothetical protein